MIDDSLVNYESLISELAYSRSDELISNNDVGHAKILIIYLFKTARQRVCIFSSTLKDAIYEDEKVIDAIKDFIANRNGRVDILIQEPSDFNHDRRIAELIQEHNDRIRVKSVSYSADMQIKSHFVVNDNSGFRFCADKDKSSAVASFNRQTTTDNLLEQFKILFNRANVFSINHEEVMAM